MKKLVNNAHIEGVLYQHNLEKKTSKNGVEYIRGDIQIATDEARLNIIKVNFRYVAPTFDKEGKKPNQNFDVLSSIIDGTFQNHIDHGADKACTIKVDSSLGLNEFFSDKNGPLSLTSVKINDGGFVHCGQNLNPKEEKRNTFEADMVITNVIDIEATDDKAAYAKVKGYIFNTFTKMALPYDFEARDKRAIDYFIGLEASESNPVFTKIAGKQINEIIRKTFSSEGAFSEVTTEKVDFNKALVIDWAAKDVYEWGEDTMTKDELKAAIAEHEAYVNTQKQNYESFKSTSGSAFASAPSAGGFNF